MTPAKKRFYLLGLFGVFVIVIPVLLLYSSGYRLNNKFRLVKTGGIYFNIGESGTQVRLNGKIAKKAGLFERNLLVDNLKPGAYNARVEKEEYRPWEKNITVQEQMVEACYPLLIRSSLEPELIPKYQLIKPESKKGKTQRQPNEEYTEAMELFRLYNKPAKGLIPGWGNSEIKKLKLGADRKLNRKVFLFREGNKIYARWTGRDEKRPFFIKSDGTISVYSPDKKIVSFGFFPGRYDSILALLEDGELYAVEIDTRFDIHNIYLIAKNCSRFIVSDELLYYFSGDALYRIDFEQ